MKHKKRLIYRTYWVYVVMLSLALAVAWNIFAIQFLPTNQEEALSPTTHVTKRKVRSNRGTIYSADGNVLSISLPFYDLYLDFSVPYLHSNHGRHFFSCLPTLSAQLAGVFQDKGAQEYTRELKQIYANQKVVLFKKNIPHDLRKTMGKFSLIEQGRYKSGFHFVQKSKRKYPYGILAKRSLGTVREHTRTNVGLEGSYNDFLQGLQTEKMMRYIGGGVYAPLDDHQIADVDGKDIITTIDTRMQDITENALMKTLRQNQAEWGTAVVMEVKTGKIRAIANLGAEDSIHTLYQEKMNYALQRLEPGSTFKIITLLCLLEDHLVSLDDEVPLYEGQYTYAPGAVMKDSEKHKRKQSSLREAFANSSNVGISLVTYDQYKQNPQKFFAHFDQLHLHETTGIDLIGEHTPVYKSPQDKSWNTSTSLPWMSIGYELELTPIKILSIYNAIANDGILVKPYLVTDIRDGDKRIKHFSPKVIAQKICSHETTRQLQTLLYEAATNGTSKRLFSQTHYKVAGKTGTSLFYGKNGYKDSIYQASFVGYFPADNPIYSCAVFIKNRPKARKYYGSSVAAPVFKEIADKLYALYYVGAQMKRNRRQRNWPNVHQHRANALAILPKSKDTAIHAIVPNLQGKTAADLVEFMERTGTPVQIAGVPYGRVKYQSVSAGGVLQKNQPIRVRLQ